MGGTPVSFYSLEASLTREGSSGRNNERRGMGRTANPDLTVDEEETLVLLSEGLTTLEIARKWNISKRAVEWRIEQMKRKLKAKTLSHAISIAYKKGILLTGNEEVIHGNA